MKHRDPWAEGPEEKNISGFREHVSRGHGAASEGFASVNTAEHCHPTDLP